MIKFDEYIKEMTQVLYINKEKYFQTSSKSLFYSFIQSNLPVELLKDKKIGKYEIFFVGNYIKAVYTGRFNCYDGIGIITPLSKEKKIEDFIEKYFPKGCK